MNMRTRFESALTLDGFLAGAAINVDFWRAQYRLAKLDDEAVARLAGLPAPRHLLALVEDWCGDAVNSIPVLARLAEETPNLDLRLLGRDANPDLMDTHLTGRSRSIPVVMVLDEHFEELGWWGPRPAELQRWVLETGLSLERKDRYREERAWYARDRGQTTVAEVSDLILRTVGDAVPPANAGVRSPSR